MSKEADLELLTTIARPDLRSLSWHTDGRVIAKTGANATNPKKLYSGLDAKTAVYKLIKDREKTWDSAPPQEAQE